jgi:hypothetical protein
MPPEEVAQMSQSNAQIILKAKFNLAESKWNKPEIFEAAKHQTARHFWDTVYNLDTKTWDAAELHVPFQLSIPKSLSDRMESCIAIAKELVGTDSRIDAVEFIFSEFWHEHQDDEGRQGDS